MSEETLFEVPAPVKRPRQMSAGQPAWVAVWGTQMALICAPDEGSVRERVQAGSRFRIEDDEINVRAATDDDRALLDQFIDPTVAVTQRLTDWKLSMGFSDDDE